MDSVIGGKRLARKAAKACGIVLAIACTTRGAGTFLEDVTVLQTFSSAGGFFGWGIAEIADISDPPDGVMDFIIPSLGESTVFVYSGADGTLIHTLTKPPADSSNGSVGYAIADAGDTNGDGVHDIIVGSPSTSGIGTNPGHAYVYSGVNGSILLELSGQAANDAFGYAVGGAGDVNEDGFADLLVGAPGNDASGNASGRAYIFSGMDGSLIRNLDAEAAGDRFGSGTAGTGDIDGDDVGDQIVGAPGAGASGRAYVYSGADGSLLFSTDADAGGSTYGQFFVAGVGDVNRDGTRDVYVGDYGANGGRGKAYVYSGVDGSVIHRFTSLINEGVGPGRGAGDVNGDGYADLLVGFYTSPIGAANAGKAVLFSGRTGTALRTMTSTTAGEAFGFDAVGVGDTNGDGYIDLLVSAASQNRVYLIAGYDFGCPLAGSPAAEIDGLPKNRFISFSPGNGGAQTAVRVTLASLHHPDPPNLPQSPAPDFSAFEGQVRWVGPPSVFSESSASKETFMGAVLQCAPHYMDWGTVGLVHVTGAEIVPSSVYEVQVIDEACAVEDEGSYSDPLTVVTSRWGDVGEPFNPPSTTTQPNFGDISELVNKFKSAVGAPIKVRALLQPNIPVMEVDLSFAEISAGVDAFKSRAYPFPGPTDCP